MRSTKRSAWKTSASCLIYVLDATGLRPSSLGFSDSADVREGRLGRSDVLRLQRRSGLQPLIASAISRVCTRHDYCRVTTRKASGGLQGLWPEAAGCGSRAGIGGQGCSFSAEPGRQRIRSAREHGVSRGMYGA